MSHNRTHHNILARRLTAATELSYQQALQKVRDAAAAGTLPEVLDEAGMSEALASLISTVEAQEGIVQGLSPRLRPPVDDADGAPYRHVEPGPHGELNAELGRRGLTTPQVVDYRPDGLYRVWRDDHVVVTAREWPPGSSQWLVEEFDDVEGPIADHHLLRATTKQAATAMAAAAAGRPLRPRSFAHLLHEHVCDARCNQFQFFARTWCVTHALELIDADPFAATFVDGLDITELDQFMGLPEPGPGMARFTWVPIDKDRAKQADLSVPLLVVRVHDGDNGDNGGDNGDNGGESDFLIGLAGWERAYRARTEARRRLPAYRLADYVERAIRTPESVA